MKGRVEDFKEHLPLIASLFNPGLRERHWEKMSTIAEQDLAPTEVGTFSIFNIWITEHAQEIRASGTYAQRSEA